MARHWIAAAALFAAGLGVLPAAVHAQAPAAAPATGSGSGTLDAVRSRGVLSCGIDGATAGFSLPDSKGVMQGIDADGCRAVAAAVLGDATKVKFVPLTTQTRFTALQSGEIDVLIRETTWTLGREANLGLLFAGVELLRRHRLPGEDGVGREVGQGAGRRDRVRAARHQHRAGRSRTTSARTTSSSRRSRSTTCRRCSRRSCRAAATRLSNDSSALAGFRATQGEHKTDFVLLPELISKEPLGPVVRKGDDKWFDLVRWTFFALASAEEAGVTSKNVDTFSASTDPTIRRLLGMEGDLGKALGVDNKWAYNAVKQVGNFAEIWDRDIAPLGIPRGLNNLWNKGGLIYPPPIR